MSKARASIVILIMALIAVSAIALSLQHGTSPQVSPLIFTSPLDTTPTPQSYLPLIMCSGCPTPTITPTDRPTPEPDTPTPTPRPTP